MCTSLAVTGTSKSGIPYALFGRNMDIEGHFGEEVVITPRGYPLCFKCAEPLDTHYAIMGMAVVADGYPLYADAMNEHGVCMAGLHFPHNAYYQPAPVTGRINLSPFELIPYLLGTCATLGEAERVLERITLVHIPFSPQMPLTPLHWHISDASDSLVLEATKQGFFVYRHPVGVLTNNPPLPFHLANLNRYAGLNNRPLSSGGTGDGSAYDLGLGAVGLPGDYSSPSRFARAAFLRRVTDWNALDRESAVAQFFGVLGAVAPTVGSVLTADGEAHATLYTCCMDTRARVYHYTTAESRGLASVAMSEEDMAGTEMLVRG